MIQLDKTIIEIFADVNFVVCFLVLKELIVLKFEKVSVFSAVMCLKDTYQGPVVQSIITFTSSL